MGIGYYSTIGSMAILAATEKTKCFANDVVGRFGKPNLLDAHVSIVMGTSRVGNRSLNRCSCSSSNSQCAVSYTHLTLPTIGEV